MRRQNARQSIFLNNLVEQVGVGLITYTKDGNIEIFNNAAKKLLQITQLSNISDIGTDIPNFLNALRICNPIIIR